MVKLILISLFLSNLYSGEFSSDIFNISFAESKSNAITYLEKFIDSDFDTNWLGKEKFY